MIKYKGRAITYDRILRYPYNLLIGCYNNFAIFIYHYFIIPRKVKVIRNSDTIKVLFVIAELGSWKTEELYLSMLSSKRFMPILGVTTSQEVPGSKSILINYLEKKNYAFIDIDKPGCSIKDLKPDIKFYYKPYENSYPKKHVFSKNLESLTCHIQYAFNQIDEAWAVNHLSIKGSWLVFLENESVYNCWLKYSFLYKKSLRVTGYPIQDMLLKNKSFFEDPWKNQDKSKKRIIYAPHHSIPGTNGIGIEYSTFLENGEFILNLAKRLGDTTQWAFKPHPTLYPKLLKIWGEEKTNSYYNEWKKLSNTQIELGEYIGLFKHSDAMIHDCSSFLIEYLFVNKPVLFLTSDKTHISLKSVFTENAYKAHYKACEKKEIANFVNDVLNGSDNMANERNKYITDYLTPPNNKSACENIMNAILGVD